MYDFMDKSSHPHLKELVRKQLEKDYGVDPATPAVQDAPALEDPTVIKAAHNLLVARWPSLHERQQKSIYSGKVTLVNDTEDKQLQKRLNDCVEPILR